MTEAAHIISLNLKQLQTDTEVQVVEIRSVVHVIQIHLVVVVVEIHSVVQLIQILSGGHTGNAFDDRRGGGSFGVGRVEGGDIFLEVGLKRHPFEGG